VLKLDNIGEVLEGIEAWVEACEDLANDTLRGLTALSFKYIVQGTPEWSGNMVANWRITVGAPAADYNETIFKEADIGGDFRLGGREPFSRVAPNAAAVLYATAIAKHMLPYVRLGADVYVSNPTPYAAEVEANAKASSGRAFLRPINLVNGRVEMLYAAADKFGALGHLSESAAQTIAGEKL
jgi:hypothetical protein